MMTTWKQVAPLGYRRPGRPGRWATLITVGLALSTVVAGLGVLGSISPTPRPATLPGVRPLPTRTTPVAGNGSTIVPTSVIEVPPGTGPLAAYAGTSVPTTTSSPNTYVMTCGSATVVVIYRGSGSDDPSGSGRVGHY